MFTDLYLRYGERILTGAEKLTDLTMRINERALQWELFLRRWVDALDPGETGWLDE